jgi:hypothetical protein
MCRGSRRAPELFGEFPAFDEVVALASMQPTALALGQKLERAVTARRS